MHISRARAFIAAALAATGLVAQASTPKFFTASSQADFLKGEVENLAIDVHGRLQLGPATEQIYETTAPFLWTTLATADGSVYVGSGNEGKVYRIDPQGKGALFYDAGELEVHALAAAPDGGLFVATSPEGRIYKVDRAGKGTPFFDPEDKYIWALAVDGKGNLFAATGDKGQVYRITPDGKGTPFYKAKATHATALAFDKAGALLVGTGTPGRVVRVDAEGKGFVLLDTPYQEVHALRFDDKGALYVAAQNGRGLTGGSDAAPAVTGGVADPNRVPVASVSTEITAVVVDVSQVAATPSPAAQRGGSKGAIYKVAADGAWDLLWDTRDDAPYDVAFDATGAVVVATGGKGKIFRLEGEPLRPTLLARATAQQVTSIFKDGRGRLVYATSNPGKVYRLSAGHAPTGTFDSEPRDAQTLASWGTLTWHGTVPQGTKIELFTRSGNNDTPDDTWSPWSAALTAAEGSPIQSPKARYLQWRAVLTGPATAPGPTLTSVSAPYLQRNIRPQVRSVTVHPPGIVFQKPFSSGEPELAGFDDQTTPDRKIANATMTAAAGGAQLGRRTYVRGLQSLAWKADDENEDELVYDVLYRREGETAWKTLRKGVSESLVVWDTTTVPNGTYYVKVLASDAPSNGAGLALVGDLDSASFDIDNTAPVITAQPARLDGARTIVAFDVVDDHSPVQKAEYSLDGQHWTTIFPKDGIADSKSEHYELVLDAPVGERGLTLRASDTLNNNSTRHVDAPKKP